MSAVQIDWHELQVAEGARVEVRVHGLLHILVAPLGGVASQQVALNPTLLRLGVGTILREGAFPHRLQDAAKHAASITVGDAGCRNEYAGVGRSIPVFDPLGDQTLSSRTVGVRPAHDSISAAA